MTKIYLYVKFVDGPCAGECSIGVKVDNRDATLRYKDTEGPYVYRLKPGTNEFYYKGEPR